MHAGRLWMRFSTVVPSLTYTHAPPLPPDQQPGTRLHEVRRIAPEFYMSMPHYYSWTKVIWDFVADPHVTPFK